MRGCMRVYVHAFVGSCICLCVYRYSTHVWGKCVHHVCGKCAVYFILFEVEHTQLRCVLDGRHFVELVALDLSQE